MADKAAAGSRKGIGGRPPNDEPSTVVRLPRSVAAAARRVSQRGLRTAGAIDAFLDVETRRSIAVPLYAAHAACGFPSPADDYLDKALDFNELLVRNPSATFAVRMAGDSMTGAGLMPGDIAVINRSLAAKHGDIVLAVIDSEFTVKRLHRQGERVTLKAENPAFADIEIAEGQSFEIWGVVTASVRVF